jgi:hypothetical protein
MTCSIQRTVHMPSEPTPSIKVLRLALIATVHGIGALTTPLGYR